MLLRSRKERSQFSAKLRVLPCLLPIDPSHPATRSKPSYEKSIREWPVVSAALVRSSLSAVPLGVKAERINTLSFAAGPYSDLAGVVITAALN